VLPEGVLIFKRFRNPHIIYWNNQLEMLLNFLPGGTDKLEHELDFKKKKSSIMTQLDELNKQKKCPWNLQ
jgi:hypothetical protein